VVTLALASLGRCGLQLVGAIRVRLCLLLVLADRLSKLPVTAPPARRQREHDERDHDDRDYDNENCAHTGDIPGRDGLQTALDE
jgi:hypothetical protein